MIVLVCGGRDMRWQDKMFEVLDRLNAKHPFDRLIHGGAQGADTLAGMWARQRAIPVTVFNADWQTHGLAAGPIRNQLMLDRGKPDLVVAFPGRSGTADMVKKAKAAGVQVIQVWPVAVTD